MCSCVYFSLVVNLSCTTLLKQINVCPVCSDSRDGSTKLTTRRSAHDRLTWHSGVEQTAEDVFTTIRITDGPHSTADSSLYALSATRECKPEGVFFKPRFTGLTASKPGYPGGRYSTVSGHLSEADSRVMSSPSGGWAEPRPLSHFLHILGHRTLLVARKIRFSCPKYKKKLVFLYENTHPCSSWYM